MARRNEFGDLIRTAREKQGLTGVELAQKMGRSHSMIVRWENGQTANAPEPDLFWAFSRTLGLEPESMLEALGYLEEDGDRPTEHAGIAALRPILESVDLDERELRTVVDLVRVYVGSKRERGTAGQ